jgi:glycerol-3-phosphate O-acyltransferase
VSARLTRDASSFALRSCRLELTFYKNSIIHWFVLEGIVSAALYASIKPHIRVAQVHHQCELFPFCFIFFLFNEL